ncbi:hypothetical protein BHE74_00025711, partial [Ensete ventricosum]
SALMCHKVGWADGATSMGAPKAGPVILPSAVSWSTKYTVFRHAWHFCVVPPNSTDAIPDGQTLHDGEERDGSDGRPDDRYERKGLFVSGYEFGLFVHRMNSSAENGQLRGTITA